VGVGRLVGTIPFEEEVGDGRAVFVGRRVFVRLGVSVSVSAGRVWDAVTVAVGSPVASAGGREEEDAA
jgi:hypothetical protein